MVTFHLFAAGSDVEVIEGLFGEEIGLLQESCAAIVLLSESLLLGDRVSTFDGHWVFGDGSASRVETIERRLHESGERLVLVLFFGECLDGTSCCETSASVSSS